MASLGQDYFRPRGDITTVLDLTDRDAQDHAYFPIQTTGSWFHREETRTIYPSVESIQDFPQRGPADWGQLCTFEIGSMPAGDLLEHVLLQFTLGSWYDGTVLQRLGKGELTTDLGAYGSSYWTYANSLGTSVIEYAEFVVGDQTVERISGEFIRAYLSTFADANSLIGISTDAIGSCPYSLLNPGTVEQTAFHPRRPYPTENGTYFCVLPFFFSRVRLKETFPLLSCHEGAVRVNVKLRSFDQVVRSYRGYRSSCVESPLGQSVGFVTTDGSATVVTTQTSAVPPAFRDVRIVTRCALLDGSLRGKYLRQPFEQLVKMVQSFHFEEPLKYLVSKGNAVTDTVDVQLPLELNHPVTELLWVFRRKAVIINNEWSNFGPAIGAEQTIDTQYPAWLHSATLRVNGSEVISADGDWFRHHIAKKHKGGWITYQSHVYGYSFADYPDEHAPSGTANMSRATSVSLRLRVRTPVAKPLTSYATPCVFDPAVVGGWEVFVFAIHYNWLRFENGLCERMFTD